MHRPHRSNVSDWYLTSRRHIKHLPLQLYKGLPAILLGILFNTLDAGTKPYNSVSVSETHGHSVNRSPGVS